MTKFINFQNLDLMITKIGDFKVYSDFHTNALIWENKNFRICASPEFEEQGICSIQVDDNEGNLSEGYEYKMNYEFDLTSQQAEYIIVVSDIIDAITSGDFDDLDSALSSIKSIYSI
jgi:hypothetical protein